MNNTVVVLPGGIDRSPSDTGTSAKMAILYSRSMLKLNQQFIHESIIGCRYFGELVEETQVGDFQAVIPTIRSSAYIVRIHLVVLDPRNPFPVGFVLNPHGLHTMIDFYQSGGVPALLKKLESRLDTSVLTVDTVQLWTLLARSDGSSGAAIAHFAVPLSPESGLTILKGNIAPNRSAARTSVIKSEMLVHRGSAVTYCCDATAWKAIVAGKIQPGVFWLSVTKESREHQG